MSDEKNTRKKVTLADRLQKALNDAQTGHGSYRPNYDSRKLSYNIEQIIAELTDATAPLSQFVLSKYHAWQQSIEKAIALIKRANHDMPEEKSALIQVSSFFIAFSLNNGLPNISDDSREPWLQAIKAGARVCYDGGSRGDASTLSDEIYDFIDAYKNPIDATDFDGLIENSQAYYSCLGKANELGYACVTDALLRTPSNYADSGVAGEEPLAWPVAPGWYWAKGRIAGMSKASIMSAFAEFEGGKIIVYVGEGMTHRLSYPDQELPLVFKKASVPIF